MIFEFAHYCFVLSTVLAAMAIFQPNFAQYRLAYIHGGLLACSFGGLVYAFVISDFSVEIVTLHSHVHSPLLYKICGVWGNTQGSMLLWLVCLQAWIICFSWKSTAEPQIKATTSYILWLLQAGFSLYCLFFNNPFQRLMPFPLEGNDLNPVLQDKALIYHPPLLYLGYTGFLLVGAFSTAIMLHKQLDLGRLRQWAMGALGFLTLGITAGSWWAYDELGWGGFWFWDPVESLSLLPWLAGTAILHSTSRPNRWGPLWGILGGCAVALNVVLVRGGVLTSVHAFAKDSYSLFILSILCISFVLPALVIYSRNAKVFPTFPWHSYPGWNSMAMGASWVIILVGVLGPLIAALFGYRLQITSTYYTVLLTPIFSGILIGMAYFMPKPFTSTITAREWFTLLGHAGYFLIFTGVMMNALWEADTQKLLGIGETLEIDTYHLTLQATETIPASNHIRTRATLALKDGTKTYLMHPERHYFTIANQSTSQSALWQTNTSLLCVILGEEYPNQKWLVKVYYDPGILLVFLGGIIIGISVLMAALRPRNKKIRHNG